MKLSTQPYKGARDFYPADKRIQDYMFAQMRQVVQLFGYEEYDAPMIESIDLYRSKTSEEIVNDQIYSFVDRGGREVAIRPEMTPTVSRMVAAKRQELAYPLRLFSIPNVWRYERPQKGRLREHWQLNVDLFGEDGIPAEHEIILIIDNLLKAFGADESMYEIQINSRLHFAKTLDNLGVDQDKQLEVSRWIDKKDKISKTEYIEGLNKILLSEQAVQLAQYLDGSNNAPEKIVLLKSMLAKSGVMNVSYNPRLVRGFDYYTDLVFEVFDKDSENNRSLFGGGRYDQLVGAFGVEPISTVGFGMGDVTLHNFLDSHGLMPNITSNVDAVVVVIGAVYADAQSILAKLRGEGICVAVDATDRKISQKLKHALKQGVEKVIFVGEQELTQSKIRLKNFQTGEEKILEIEKLVEELKKHKQ